jgi:hypothetical protein
MQALRTTLELPAPLMRDVKARAAQTGVSMKVLLTQWIEAALLRSDEPSAALQASASLSPMRPLPSFVRPKLDNLPMQPALSNAELHALLDDEDVARVLSVSGS